MTARDDTHPEPAFGPPTSSGYLYLGLSVDPPALPRAGRSAEREGVVERCRVLAQQLSARPDVVRARVFEAVLIPPLKGMPRFDVTMLVETTSPDTVEAVRASTPFAEIGASLVVPAVNPVTLGDTEHPSTGFYLFNHFLAPSGDAAVAGWKSVAGWYTDVIGVDNSLPLRPVGEAPFALINYARIPGGPLPFLLGQLTRPSFHGFVRPRLRRHGMTALPLLTRPR
ncbi:hypothetical protein [Nonomuraea sp. NPDC050310]|uniref:hypothetical protein n=1 Tax=Nonomuraea sp. NPDC050310 TaxID=3154935 RepID=UPI0033F269A7